MLSSDVFNKCMYECIAALDREFQLRTCDDINLQQCNSTMPNPNPKSSISRQLEQRNQQPCHCSYI